MVTSAGIFLVNKEGKILIGHPTNHDPNFWSIPKGKIDKGESAFEAAVRETWEESNVDVSTATIYHELDKRNYKSKKKRLKPFVILESENPELDLETVELKCNTNVPEKMGGFPEMDDFKWVTIDEARELLHESQVRCLDDVAEIYNENKED